MTKIQYALDIYNETDKRNYELKELDSLPRFEIGDQFDNHFFNTMSDVGWRAIVTDARYFFSGTPEKPEIRLRLNIREETIHEQAKRQKQHGA